MRKGTRIRLLSLEHLSQENETGEPITFFENCGEIDKLFLARHSGSVRIGFWTTGDDPEDLCRRRSCRIHGIRGRIVGQIENIALLILSLGLGLSSTLMSNRFMKRHLPSGVDCLRSTP